MTMTPFLKDLAERVIWTFVQSASAALILAGFTSLDPLQAAAIGGVTAVLSVLKGAAAFRLNELGTPQLGSRTYSHNND